MVCAMQVDGLAMSVSLAVVLTNLWLKAFEFALRQEIPVETEINRMKDENGLCPCCRR